MDSPILVRAHPMALQSSNAGIFHPQYSQLPKSAVGSHFKSGFLSRNQGSEDEVYIPTSSPRRKRKLVCESDEAGARSNPPKIDRRRANDQTNGLCLRAVKDSMFKKQIAHVQDQIELVKKGSHTCLKKVSSELKELKDKSMHSLARTRKHRIAVINELYENELRKIKELHDKAIDQLKEQMIYEVNQQIRKLENARDGNPDDGQRRHTRNLRSKARRGGEGPPSPDGGAGVNPCGPLPPRSRRKALFNMYLTYALQPDEINEDFELIKSGC